MTQIETQMNQLRLQGMAQSWKIMAETRQTHELSFTNGIEMLLQAETDMRSNRRLDRLIKGARFRYQASIQELNFEATRGLDKSLVNSLAMGQYVEKGEAILITGAAGCGKSFLASALGQQACSQGFSVEYYNTQKLLIRAKMARVEGNAIKFFDKLSKVNLLILDDFGFTHFDKQQQLDLMEIVEDRHSRAATIISSQLPVENWFDVIENETIADAILDRIVHTAYRIELKGESLRKKR
jgi:DNA replication protein DnaC